MLDAGDIFFQTTPHWAVNDGYTLGYLGQERYGRQFRIGTMVRGGACVTFGSDSCLEPRDHRAAGGSGGLHRELRKTDGAGD